MNSTRAGRNPKIKTSLLLAMIIPVMVFGLYFGYNRLFKNNINNINTIFSGESLYTTVDNLSYSGDPGLLLMAKADTFDDIEKQDSIDEIDIMISDSVESESMQINYQREEDESSKTSESTNKQNNQDSESPPAEKEPSQEVAAESGTNYAESQMIHLINSIRSSRGLQPLNPNPVLNSIARSRSRDMINRGYFSHYTPEGKNIFNILVENGIMYACGAENLSQGSPPSWANPESVINNWMSSGIHRANLLNPHFGQLGLGVVDSGSRRVVTLILINR